MTTKISQDPKLNPFLIVRPILDITTNKIDNGQETIVRLVDDLDDWEESQVDTVRFVAEVNATLRTGYTVWVNDQIWARFDSRGTCNAQEQAWFLQSTQTLASLREEASMVRFEDKKAEMLTTAKATFAGSFV